MATDGDERPAATRGTCSESHAFDSHVIDRVWFLSAGHRIAGWVMRPPGNGPYPVVIYNHGSRVSASGVANLDRPTLAFSTRAWPGVAAGRCLVFFPEGRGYAGSEGPRLTDCRSKAEVMAFLRGRADDVAAGLDWLAGQPWADTDRVGLIGCSHGAVVSLLAAPLGRYRSVVAQAPGASILDPTTGLDEMAEAVCDTDAPILLQHAEDDMLCPVEISRTLHLRGRQAGRDVSLSVYPRVPGIEGHAQFDFANRAIWAAELDAASRPVVGDPPIVVADQTG